MANGDIHIGFRPVWGQWHPFGIAAENRQRHCYIIGQTGTGKSTLLKTCVAQDIAAGEGLALIDPHGDLVDEVLELIPGHRIDDVIVLDPSDRDHVVGFNPFYRVPQEDQALVASNLVASFRHVWSDSWGPRLEYILYNCVAALLEASDPCRATFLAIPRLLVEHDYRQRVLADVRDPRVRSFFHDEFERWNDRQISEALAPVQNKIGQVISNPQVRNVLSQWHPRLSLDAVLARRQILLVRLPKGQLGADPANLLGSLLVAGILQAAMRREDERQRVPFHLYIDEFHNFTTDAFASILSEARKYALTLTIGHQYFDQLLPSVRAAVLGNVGSIVAFRVGADDAAILSEEFGDIAPGVLRDLTRGQVVVRLTETTQVSQAFRGDVEPLHFSGGRSEQVIAKSRRTYSRNRTEVERNIRRWLQNYEPS